MKVLLLFCFTLFVNASVTAQSNTTADMLTQMKVGTVKKGTITTVINPDDFVNAANKIFFEGKNVINRFSIESGYTQGDEKRLYYCVHLSSGTGNINMVRLLTERAGGLFIEPSAGEEFTIYDFYVTCEGIDMCSPKLFFIAGELS